MTSLIHIPAMDGESKQRALAHFSIAELDDPSESASYQRMGGAYRAAPLLRVVGERGSRRIIVGRLRTSVTGTSVEVVAAVSAIWSEAMDWRQTDDRSAVRTLLETRIMSTAHEFTPGDDEALAAVIAKAAAEESRNDVAALREVRYELESALAAHLRRDKAGSVVPSLAVLMELALAVSRAQDEARAAKRNGLSLSLSDKDAHHTYRRAMDPTLMNGHEPAHPGTRTWMRTHDAASRQVAAMETQLAEEAAHMAALLDAVSTIAVARDAEAQEAFNTLTAVAALGLGLPALVLAMYGTGRLVPLTWAGVPALIPVALAAMGAGAVAVVRLPYSTLKQRAFVSVALVVVLMVLLVGAGWLAPPNG